MKTPHSTAANDPSLGLRVAIYTRISTDEKNQPYSLGAQEQALRDFASARGWIVVAHHSDQKSGATMDRPGLQAALTSARAGSIDVLLVYRLDRLARQTQAALSIISDLESAGAKFVSVTENFDTVNAHGRLALTMAAAFASFERDVMIDRISQGIAAKAAKGLWVGGAPPFGYQVERKTWVLVPDPDEAPIVQAAFARQVETKCGAVKLRDWLNESGHRTRRGALWSSQGVLDMLTRPTYIGLLTFRGEVIQGQHEPLIDMQTWEAVQAVRVRRSSHARRVSEDSPYLLSGLLQCTACGQALVASSSLGTGKRRYRYYVCGQQTRRGRLACDSRRLPAGDVERAVRTAVLRTYADTGL
jgi:site-specific DNA recombinase